MPRSLRTFLPVVGDPAALAAAFEDDPERWLPAARRRGPDRWRLLLHAGTLTRAVEARVGSTWRVGATRWRTLSWDPVGDDGAGAVERLLPSLDGELGLHLPSGGPVTVVLDARYQPPGGLVGEAVDVVALHRVARATCSRFLETVAARLSSEAVLSVDAGPPRQDGASAVAT